MTAIKDRLKAKNDKFKGIDAVKSDDVVVARRPQTAPGTMAQLAMANSKIAELEAQIAGSSEVMIDRVTPNPWQPRRTFPEAELNDLAQSIREVGLIQPIIVRPNPDVEGRYQIVAGERRFRACVLLQMQTIPVRHIEMSDADMAVLAVAENLNREDLSDYEIARSVINIQRIFPNRSAIAEAFGMTRPALYRYLKFEKLPEFVLSDLELYPKILGSTAAEKLALLLETRGAPAAELLADTWPKLVNGLITQFQLIDTLEKTGARVRSANITEGITPLFFKGGKVGTVKLDASHLTVRVKTKALTDEQINKVKTLFESFYT